MSQDSRDSQYSQDSRDSEIGYAQGSPSDSELMEYLLAESEHEGSEPVKRDTYLPKFSEHEEIELYLPKFSEHEESDTSLSKFNEPSISLKSPKLSPVPITKTSPYSQSAETPSERDSMFDPTKENRRRDINSLKNLYNGLTSPFGLHIMNRSKTTTFELNDQQEYSLSDLMTIRNLLELYDEIDYGEEVEIPIWLRSGEDTHTYPYGTTITRLYNLTDEDADNIIATMLSNNVHFSLICISLVNHTAPAFSIGYGHSSDPKEDVYYTPDGRKINVKDQDGGIYVLDENAPTPNNPSVLAGAKILRINDIHRINNFLQKGSMANCIFQKQWDDSYKLLNIIITGDGIPKFAESKEIDRIEKELRSMGVPIFDFINRYNCVRVGSRKLLNLLLQCGDVSLPGDCPEVDKERFYQLRNLIFKLQRTSNENKRLQLLSDLTSLIEDIDKTLGIIELPSHYTEAELSQLSQLYADSQKESFKWGSLPSSQESLKLGSLPPQERVKWGNPPSQERVKFGTYGGRKTKNKKRKYKYTKKNGKKHNKTRGKKSRRRNTRKHK
jgi:hypothetical protein